MKNNKAIVLVVVLLVIIGGVWWVNKNKNVSPVPLVSLTNQSQNDSLQTGGIEKTKRIIYRKDGEQGAETLGDLYSTDFDNKNPINLSKTLNLPLYTKVVSNQDLSKISYVTQTNSDVFLWKANTDGSEVKKMLQTNNTGCNILTPLYISDDGRAIIFNYIPYYEGEIGRCIPRGEPKMNKAGYFYSRDGSEIKDLMSSGNLGGNGNDNVVMGFYGNEILIYPWVSNKFGGSVFVMNPETMKSTKLFNVPEEILGSTYPPTLFIYPGSSKIAFSFFQGTSDGLNKSKIGFFDYQGNILETVVSASGKRMGYEIVGVSPNLENLIYAHATSVNGGQTVIDYFVYNASTKKSTALPFGSSYRQLSVLWKDNDSFVYRLPLIEGWPPREPGTAMLFDLKNFKSRLLLSPVTEIISSWRRSI